KLLEKDKSIAELSRNLIIATTAGIILLAGLIVFNLRQKSRERELKFQREAKLQLEIEVKLRTEEIRQKKEELELTGGIKDKLFSIVSHDLKGPLNSLKGTLHILQTGALNEKEFKTLAGNIEGQLQKTSEFLDNLLQWAKSQMQGQVIR